MDELLAFVGEEFEKLLNAEPRYLGEAKTFTTTQVMNLFYKAWVLGLSRYARKKGVDLT